MEFVFGILIALVYIAIILSGEILGIGTALKRADRFAAGFPIWDWSQFYWVMGFFLIGHVPLVVTLFWKQNPQIAQYLAVFTAATTYPILVGGQLINLNYFKLVVLRDPQLIVWALGFVLCGTAFIVRAGQLPNQ